ncbi:retinaldehyde-binding protein 1-like [Oscarella lobularis]|uniref:retinaldehyde-binding protein 1-like n=1 Tax=Oscarella lobularis TaxID=121494 RepID=UPI003313C0A0
MSYPFPSLQNLDHLSDSTKEKAARELNESDETRQTKIDELRRRIDEFEGDESVFVDSRRDDAFLVRFLRARKFDVDRAFTQYKSYFEYRKNHPEIFKEMTLEKVAPFLRSGTFTIGNRTTEGAQIIYMDISKMHVAEFSNDYSLRALAFCLDVLIESQETQVNGFRDVLSMGKNDVKKMIEFVQDCFPARFKGIHILHQPWYVTIILTLMKPFLKKKMKERLHFHGYDYTAFHKVIDPEHLPESMGGNLPEVDPELWIDYLTEKSRGTLIE